MADLTTRVNVKSLLGIPTAVTDHDTLIDTLIDVVDEEIKGYCGITALSSSSITEKVDVPDSAQRDLRLNTFPVISVTSVSINDTVISSDDYYVDKETGYIRLKGVGSFFTHGYQQISVVYSAGFSAIPADLSHAATILAAAHFNGGRHAGMLYEQTATYRYRRREGMPEEVIRILSRYRRVFAKAIV